MERAPIVKDQVVSHPEESATTVLGLMSPGPRSSCCAGKPSSRASSWGQAVAGLRKKRRKGTQQYQL